MPEPIVSLASPTVYFYFVGPPHRHSAMRIHEGEKRFRSVSPDFPRSSLLQSYYAYHNESLTTY